MRASAGLVLVCSKCLLKDVPSSRLTLTMLLSSVNSLTQQQWNETARFASLAANMVTLALVRIIIQTKRVLSR
jgi:hypothetical protein